MKTWCKNLDPGRLDIRFPAIASSYLLLELLLPNDNCFSIAIIWKCLLQWWWYRWCLVMIPPSHYPFHLSEQLFLLLWLKCYDTISTNNTLLWWATTANNGHRLILCITSAACLCNLLIPNSWIMISSMHGISICSSYLLHTPINLPSSLRLHLTRFLH